MKKTRAIAVATSVFFIVLTSVAISATAGSEMAKTNNYCPDLLSESLLTTENTPQTGATNNGPQDKIKEKDKEISNLTKRCDSLEKVNDTIRQNLGNLTKELDSLKAANDTTNNSNSALADKGEESGQQTKSLTRILFAAAMLLILLIGIAALVLILLMLSRMPKDKKSKKHKDNEIENGNNDNNNGQGKGKTNSNLKNRSFDSDNTFIFADELTDVENKVTNALHEVLKDKQDDFKGKIEEIVESRSAALQQKIDNLEKRINNFDAEKSSAISNATTSLNKKIEELQEENKRLIDLHKQELQTKDNMRTDEINSININHENEINRLKEEHQETLSKYKKHITIYEGCEPFSKPVMELFEKARTLHQKQAELCEKVYQKKLSEAAKDEFNRYYTNAVNKYEKATKEFDINTFEREFYLLNTTEMALAKQTIDGILNRSESKKFVDNLRSSAYQKGLGKFCGAAVVLSDDLKSLSRFCKDSVSGNDVSEFKQITEDLRKTIEKLGYELAYVELFHPLSEYSHIAEAGDHRSDLEGFNEDDIVGVLEMAVNYGNAKKKMTQVCKVTKSN